MVCFTPSRDPRDADGSLSTLISPCLTPLSFAGRVERLQRMFSAYKAGCPPPWSAPHLQITPEITFQSECWLPLDELRRHFYCFYRHVLTYPPVFASTPFANGTSWAAVVAGFPGYLTPSCNPANLLERLLSDAELRLKFLFWSFMPERYYGGGSDRYPEQFALIAGWIGTWRNRGRRLRCLDAASGDGANTYEVARLLVEQGWSPERFSVEGWTLDPLEAWAAAHGIFPHDPAREESFREATAVCFEQGCASVLRFSSVNLLDVPPSEPFDLILCNGLLGGPIIHTRQTLAAVVRNLAGLLAPGGILLAADHFHGGWKQKCPQQELRALFELHGLVSIEAEEGVAILKTDQ
jgi:SAM-dependent methyltransferase